MCFTEQSTHRRRPVHVYEPERRRRCRPSDRPSHTYHPRPDRPITPCSLDTHKNTQGRDRPKQPRNSFRYIGVESPTNACTRHCYMQYAPSGRSGLRDSMACTEYGKLQQKIIEQNKRIARRPSLRVAPLGTRVDVHRRVPSGERPGIERYREKRVRFADDDELARPMRELRLNRG